MVWHRFEPEYVNIFSVPFTFLPHESTESGPPPPPAPKTLVQVGPAKAAYEIRWPNVVRIEYVFQPVLTVDWDRLSPPELDAASTAQLPNSRPS